MPIDKELSENAKAGFPEFSGFGDDIVGQRNDRLRAGLSRNHGAADGVHARCFPALWRGNSGRQQNRGVFAAKFSCAQRTVSRGV